MNRFTLIFIFCTIFTFAHSTLGNGQTVKCNPASGTLPIIYITTSSGQEITSKDNYLGARYYIDASGCKDFVSVGSADAQLGTQIKGRGNHTWYNFDKKPYKLKLSERRGLLGMKSNRHFVLLAHADDKNAFLRNTIGFEVSRLFGMEYTPSQVPVEL